MIHIVLSIVTLIVSLQAAAQFNPKQPHETWQTAAKKERPRPHLPPMLKTSEKGIENYHGYISYQVNLTSQGENRLYDAANEPSLAVNPLNPMQIAIGWRQFDNINSDFRQAGVAYSTDGGQSWHNNGPLEPGIFRSDPVLSADADGTFFYQSLQVIDDNGFPGIQDNDTFQVDQWRSDNGGRHWYDKTNALGGDKSWFVVDTSHEPSRGNIYAAWNLAGNNYYPKSFNYSVDNGHSFTTPVEIPQSPVYSTLAMGSNNEIYIAGVYGDGDFDDLYLVKSNQPTSPLFPAFNQVTSIDMGGKMAVGGINPVGLLGQMWVAVDKSERHTRGRVYVLSSIDVQGPDPLDIQFIMSQDGGVNFSSPKRINTDENITNWQWFGTMGVAPNGRIDVIWLDTREDNRIMYDKILSQLFYSYSYDGGVTFSENQPISAPFYHGLGYPVQRKMGDYIDVVSGNKGAHIAYTATFNGGQDVYYLHAKPAAYEENPYFPGQFTDTLWHHPNVPRQGVFSRTLVVFPDNPNSHVIHYETVFTETPAGQPTWFVMEQKQAATADEVVLPVLHPTGDLTNHQSALALIGQATKKRVYDDKGELVADKMIYAFDMTESVLQEMIADGGYGDYLDPDFYRNSDFYNTEKSIVLDQLITSEQPRETACDLRGLPMFNPDEVAEGRVSVIFNRQQLNQTFEADFSYEKYLDDNGIPQYVLNQAGRAIPQWWVYETMSGDVVKDQSTEHIRYRSAGGNGFFVLGAPDPELISGGTQTVSRINETSVLTTTENGTEELLTVLAYNSYCGR